MSKPIEPLSTNGCWFYKEIVMNNSGDYAVVENIDTGSISVWPIRYTKIPPNCRVVISNVSGSLAIKVRDRMRDQIIKEECRERVEFGLPEYKED